MIKKLKDIINKRWISSMDEYDVTIEILESKKKKGAIIVDVRSPQEFEEGHIEDAISIPEYDIENIAQNKLKDKSTQIVVYCDLGTRSKKAQKKLKKLGYSNVYNLYQGRDNYF